MSNVNFGALWAKKSDDGKWLPLHAHLSDTAEVARILWNTWVPEIIKNKISQGIIADGVCGHQISLQLFVMLSYSHDIGKAAPIFQYNDVYGLPDVNEYIREQIIKAGFPPPKEKYICGLRHELITHVILNKHGIDDSVAVIVGGHHGKPPDEGPILDIDEGAHNSACGFGIQQWESAQEALLQRAFEVSGLSKDIITTLNITRPAQVLLNGLLIMADWIASDEKRFPYIFLEESAKTLNSVNRASKGFKSLKFPEKWYLDQDWGNLFDLRFGIESLRPVQQVAAEVAMQVYPHSAGIFVIEAPMGEGKTEAALAVAEILASKVSARGLYFALPSQATSNAMLERVVEWLETYNQRLGVRLVHGKSGFNEYYNDITRQSEENNNVVNLSDVNIENDEESNVIVHEWFKGRKKGLLADFAIGTIDHLLMVGLKQKHLALRHMGLAGKVVIVDECHAYDVYMESYLLKALNWLGAYGVPIIILSATLPTARRRAVIEAYLGKKGLGVGEEWAESLSYPLITYTDGMEVKSVPVDSSAGRSTKVNIYNLDEASLLTTLDKVLENGGCAGVIFNTVKRAQEYFAKIEAHFKETEVDLLHGGFIAADRVLKEENLLLRLGKPKTAKQRPFKCIVVGTQIFEQSLDIDFDVLITELCPIDLLLQRIGRLHRHERVRPIGLEFPRCYVIGANESGFDGGSAAIYSTYLLMRTTSALVQKDTIELPNDIPTLVAEAYSSDDSNIPKDVRAEWKKKNDDRKSNASKYQISHPKTSSTLINWLDTSIRDDSEKRAEAAVRDGADSIEVLLIQKRQGNICLLPWIRNGEVLGIAKPPDWLAKIIAGCSVRLPSIFARGYMIDRVISSLEADMVNENIKEGWYSSYWLKGALFLILDENQEAIIGDYVLIYEQKMGLSFRERGNE